MDVNINLYKESAHACAFQMFYIFLQTVSMKPFINFCKFFNLTIISLPGLPNGQHTWGAFSILGDTRSVSTTPQLP